MNTTSPIKTDLPSSVIPRNTSSSQHPAQQPAPATPVVSSNDAILLAEIAERIQLPKRTLQSACQNGALKHELRGKRYYVTEAATMEWLQNKRRSRTPIAHREMPAVPADVPKQGAVTEPSSPQQHRPDPQPAEKPSDRKPSGSPPTQDTRAPERKSGEAPRRRLRSAKNMMRKMGPRELRNIQGWIQRRLGKPRSAEQSTGL